MNGNATWGEIEACAQALVELARSKNITIATAESCTGGGIGAAITDISGSSAVYLGGIIAYSNTIKSELLNVPTSTLKANGAVSAEVAKAMAKGACVQLGSDISVAVTGIAGPTGGTNEKPVGLIYIAVASPNKETFVDKKLYGNLGRTQIRMNTVLDALVLLGNILRKP